MKIFLALLFVIFTLIGLIKGTAFKRGILNAKEIAKDYYENYYNRDKTVYEKEIMVATVPIAIGVFVMMVLELLFYMSVVSIPALTLPTIVMMTLFLATQAYVLSKIGRKPKGDYTVLEKSKFERDQAMKIAQMPTRTAYGMFLKFISLLYFVYALLVLISI